MQNAPTATTTLAPHEPCPCSLMARRLASILDSSDDAIIGKTLEGTVTSWNRAAERIFGYRADEMIGQPVTRIFPPDRLDEERDILSRIARGQRIVHLDTVRLRRDGAPLHVSATISPIFDTAGAVVGASKIARDIGVGPHAEGLPTRNEASLREAQRIGQIGSWEWTIESDTLVWSEQMYRMFGQDPGRRPPSFQDQRSLFLPEGWDRLQAAAAETRVTGSGYVLSIQFVRPDGTEGWAEMRGETIVDRAGVIVGLRGTSQDISDRREAERESMRRSRAATRWSMMALLMELSERTRQFLNGAMGAARVMKLQPADVERRDRWIDHIVESGNRLATAFSEKELAHLLDSHLASSSQAEADTTPDAARVASASAAPPENPGAR
ncbi:MAG: PAS domain S-box protein [Caldimonas sp.]